MQASLGPAGQKLGGASEAGPGAEQPPVEGVTPVASEPSQAASVPAPAVTTGPSQGPQDQAGKGVAGVSAETPQPPTRAKAPFRIGRVETELRCVLATVPVSVAILGRSGDKKNAENGSLWTPARCSL